jgi:two-component system response regulator AtoC
VNCSEMPGDLLEIELFGRRNGSNGSASGRTGLGKLEIGENGTLLLDEITAMPLSLQTRLLQVLQNKRFSRPGDDRPVEVGVRILAASSDKVDRALAEKRLHDGLYYRLSAFTIHVPPLRQRKDEIKALVRYSMHKLARYYGLPPRDFSSSVLEACFNHSWPGNLEELETFVKRYLVAGDKEFPVSGSESGFGSNGDANGRTVGISANPPVPDGSRMTVAKSLKALIQGIKCETERNAIAAALGKTGWNRKAAARLMGVSYRTMLYKIDQYHMSAPETFLSPFLRSPVPITPKEMEK